MKYLFKVMVPLFIIFLLPLTIKSTSGNAFEKEALHMLMEYTLMTISIRAGILMILKHILYMERDTLILENGAGKMSTITLWCQVNRKKYFIRCNSPPEAPIFTLAERVHSSISFTICKISS